MMTLTQINALKSQIACPTKYAKDLLVRAHGDISQAIALYHDENVAQIIAQTACGEQQAQKYYRLFHHNKHKAISKIKQLQEYDTVAHNIITTRDDKRRHLEAGLDIYVKPKNCHHDLNGAQTFIPIADYWLIRHVFSNHCTDYDDTHVNEFDHQAILNIVHELSLLTDSDKTVVQFYQDIIAWLQDNCQPDTIIETYGNI